MGQKAKQREERQEQRERERRAAAFAREAAQVLAIHQSNKTAAEQQKAIESLGFTPVILGGQSVARQSTQQPPPDDSVQSGGTVATGGIPSGLVNTPMYNAAREAANLQTQKEIENLRQAGQTERQKLVNENNLAVTGMEVKGKLDLQGIVNAGYKNIANIERGSNMFSSIMGAFNF